MKKYRIVKKIEKDTTISIHSFLSRKYEKRKFCDFCGGTERKIEWALITGKKYSRNPKDYKNLCTRCHRWYDHDLITRKTKNNGVAKKTIIKKIWLRSPYADIEMAKSGGEACFKKYGKEYYQKMGKRSGKARAKNRIK